MANNLGPITTDITIFANKLLAALSSKLVMWGRVTQGSPVGSTAGTTIAVADMDVAGAAAVRAIGGAATASDIIAVNRNMVKQQIYKAVTVENLHLLFSSVPVMDRLANRLAYKVAKAFDAILIGFALGQAAYEVGKIDGTASFNATDVLKPLNDARKQLIKNEADTDQLYCVLGPTEAANFRSLSNLFKVNEAGSSDLLRQGLMGSILGFEMLESQQVVNSTALIASGGDVAWTVTGAHAIGATTLVVGAAGAGTIKKGVVFTIAAEVNGAGNPVGHTVTADATITSNAATLSIWPPLTMAFAGTDVITANAEHITTAGSNNLCWHPDAIQAAVVAPEPFPEGSGVQSVTVRDEQTGLGIRIAAQSKLLGGAGSAYTTDLAADLVVAAMMGRPEFAVRLNGAA
jgi:hypothetical protein